MENRHQHCANCGVSIRSEMESGGAQCRSCGAPLHGAQLDLEAMAERRRWRRAFWWIFFLTPILSLLGALLPSAMQSVGIPVPRFLPLGAPSRISVFLGAPILGALAAGYCLMKQRGPARTLLQSLLLPVAYGIGILIIYCAILFMGCVMFVAIIHRG